MKLKGLLAANLVLISFAVTVPVTHVFALPQRFVLDADLWNYAFGYFRRAWSDYMGVLAIATFAISLMYFVGRRKDPLASRLSLNAAFAYAALGVMIFVSGPAELEHAVGFALAVFGWLALLGASLIISGFRRPIGQD